MPPGAPELLHEVDRLLARRYGTPRLGNKRNPVSELVYIVLSARTRGAEHEAFYRRLRRAFPMSEQARDARTSEIERVIHDAGLSRIKARQIKSMLRRIARAGASPIATNWPRAKLLSSRIAVGLGFAGVFAKRLAKPSRLVYRLRASVIPRETPAP
jgi:endonuclease III